MKRFALFALLAALLGLGALAALSYLEHSGGKRELIKELSPLACDLNATSCKLMYKNKELEVSLSPRPIMVLDELELRIRGLDEIKGLQAAIYGLNMYMGDVVGEFERQESGDYVASVVLSSCALPIMRFRLELLQGDRPLGSYIDFDVEK